MEGCILGAITLNVWQFENRDRLIMTIQNKIRTFFQKLCLIALGAIALPSVAMAEGLADWGFSFQPAATSSAQRIHDFHDLLLVIITLITLFVLVLLIYVAVRYNKRANKEPSNVTHNVLLEVIWTVIPVVILIVIAVPSFKLLYKNDRIEKPEMVVKINGYQWYWGYEYPDNDGITFDSYMIPDEEIKEGQIRLLSTDNALVLPVDTDIAILVTAHDVIHAWTIPAFGVKIDAVPGRTNETWFRIDKPGVYYGQCSEICGRLHGYMPIEVHAVSKEEFKAWTEKAKEKFSVLDTPLLGQEPIKVTALATQ